MRRGSKIINYFYVLFYMVFIFYLSSIPLKFPETINKIDPTKFSLHVIEYMILGFLLFNAKKDLKSSFVIGSLYGLTDEIHQFFVPFRTFSYLDLIADCLGSFLGALIFHKFIKR